MKATISLGGELDFVSKDELDDAFNTHKDWLQKEIERSWFSEHNYAYRTLGNAALWVTGNTSPLVLPADAQPSPPAGRIWELMILTITAGDDHTSNAATVASYIGQMPLPGTTPPPLQLLDPAGAIPNSSAWGRDQAVVMSHDSLFVIINSPVNNTTYTVTARVLERMETKKLLGGIR